MSVSLPEVQKLAALSKLTVVPHDSAATVTNIDDLLVYAARIQKVAQHVVYALPTTGENRVRDDVPGVCEPRALLERAPQQEEGFFVVPSIL